MARYQSIKAEPVTVELYQYDDTPANGRQPLLLVHGLNGECKPTCNWGPLCRYLEKNPNFQKRYKIYLARYDTYDSLRGLENCPA
jgi:hypothetical protein